MCCTGTDWPRWEECQREIQPRSLRRLAHRDRPTDRPRPIDPPKPNNQNRPIATNTKNSTPIFIQIFQQSRKTLSSRTSWCSGWSNSSFLWRLSIFAALRLSSRTRVFLTCLSAELRSLCAWRCGFATPSTVAPLPCHFPKWWQHTAHWNRGLYGTSGCPVLKWCRLLRNASYIPRKQGGK